MSDFWILSRREAGGASGFMEKLQLMGISSTELEKYKRERTGVTVQTSIEHKVDTDGKTKYYRLPLEKQPKQKIRWINRTLFHVRFQYPQRAFVL